MLKALTTDSSAVVFDLESDGLLDKLSTIHCLCTSQPGRYRASTIQEGLEALRNAGTIIGHNIIGFDIPAIQKLHPTWKPTGRVIDTLVLSRLAHPTLKELDYIRRPAGLPGNLYGSHSLEAWGHRLGVLKGSFGKTTDWSAWTPEMEDYCAQDVTVTQALLAHLAGMDLSEKAVSLEMDLQDIIAAQERWGFQFDVQGAQRLNAQLQERRSQLLVEMQHTFPAKPALLLGPYENQRKRVDRLLAALGKPADSWRDKEVRESLESQGIKFKWSPEEPFNPNSERQIEERFRTLGWVPTEFTDTGQAQLDEPILLQLGEKFPEGRPLAEYTLVEKRLGQISQGKHAWLKMVTGGGRIHGRCNTMGAVSFRFTHSSPNMSQVPSVRAPYGKECRGFFGAKPGWKLVGCDVSGLELRILAHYMARWDEGTYAAQVLDGDIHTHNQQAAGLQTRDQAKTFIYALIYGAGDAKLGQIALPNERDSNKLIKQGKALRSRFLSRVFALRNLTNLVRLKAAKEKKLIGIDGRILRVRSAHSALNLLVQSAGAIAVKVATVEFRKLMEQAGYMMQRDWCLVVHVHDEWQTEVKQEIASYAAATAIQGIVRAGEILGLRCPLTGEAKVGNNWAETH